MKCSDFQEILFAQAVDGQRDPDPEATQRHLESCDGCRASASRYAGIGTALQQAREAEPSPFAATRILQRIENTFAPERKPAWLRILQPAAIAMALGCGLLVGGIAARREAARDVLGPASQGSIEQLRADLFIDAISEQDKTLVLK